MTEYTKLSNEDIQVLGITIEHGAKLYETKDIVAII